MKTSLMMLPAVKFETVIRLTDKYSFKERMDAPAMKFDLEKDDFGNFLVASPGDEEVIVYQAEMITNNKIPGLLQADLRRKDGKLSIHYNITSKISLQQLLAGTRVNKYQLVKILYEITNVMINSSGYLLYNKCYILKWEMIYVKPDTFELSMVYIPCVNDNDINQSLKKLVMDLIVNATYAEDDEGRDNIIQKIINYLKSETFNVTGLNRLISRMMEPEIPEKRQDTDEECEFVETPMVVKTRSFNKSSCIFAVIAAFEVLVFVFLYKSGGIIALLGGNIRNTLFLIALTIVILDFFLYRLLHRKKTESSHEDEPVSESFDDRTVLLSKEEGSHFYLIDMADDCAREYKLKEGDNTIGRLKNSVDCHIENNAVGKIHAGIKVKSGRCYICDLNSTNGTKINDTKIRPKEEKELLSGDRVTFADHDFLFLYK